MLQAGFKVDSGSRGIRPRLNIPTLFLVSRPISGIRDFSDSLPMIDHVLTKSDVNIDASKPRRTSVQSFFCLGARALKPDSRGRKAVRHALIH